MSRTGDGGLGSHGQRFGLTLPAAGRRGLFSEDKPTVNSKGELTVATKTPRSAKRMRTKFAMRLPGSAWLHQGGMAPLEDSNRSQGDQDPSKKIAEQSRQTIENRHVKKIDPIRLTFRQREKTAG
jgi:hypothetical protein